MARFSRRQFLAAAAALLAASCAQQQGRVFRVGLIGNIRPDTDPDAERLYGIFVEALRDLGYIEGTNLIIERRFAEGRLERYSAHAAEFARLNVDVIVVGSGPGVRAAMESTERIPIVMNGASDPVAAGLVASLAHPGGNVTGVADLQIDLIPKRLSLLKQGAPKISRVLFLHSRYSGFSASTSEAVEREQDLAAERLGVTLLRLEMRGPQDLESAAASIIRRAPDALLLSPNPTNYVVRRELAAFALKQRLPTIGGSRVMAAAGALMSYGPDLGDHYRKVAGFVDKVLKGANPADIPVEQPTKFEFVINLDTARSLGLSIPSALLLQADAKIP